MKGRGKMSRGVGDRSQCTLIQEILTYTRSATFSI